jgi:hypothetical protein
MCLPAACSLSLCGFRTAQRHIRCQDIPEARGSADGYGTMLQAGKSWVRVSMKSTNFLSLPNLSKLHHDPEVYSASKRKENQKIFRGVKRSRRVRLTTSPTYVNLLFGKCGIL